jgi:hypothetical protein
MTTYSDAVLTNSPLFYYRMEEASGALVNSGSAGGTVTKIGSPTWATGADGRGFSFSGSDGFSIATSNDFTNGKVFAVEAWVKITQAQNTGYNTIVRRDGTGIFLMRVRGTDLGTDVGKLEVYVSGSGGARTVLSNGRIDDGNWHHCLFTVSSGSVAIYVDGTVQTSGSTPGGSMSTTTPIYIGQNPTGGERFKGVLDEVAIYNSSDGTTLATHAGVSRTPVSPQTDINVSVSPMTGSGLFTELAKVVRATPATGQGSMPDVGVNVGKNIAVSPMTGSGSSPMASADTNVLVLYPTEDRGSAAGTGSTNPIPFYNNAGGSPTLLFRFAGMKDQQATSATLVFTDSTGSNAGSINLGRVTSSWSEADSGTPSIIGVLTNQSFSSGVMTSNVLSIVNGWQANTFVNQGISLSRSGSTTLGVYSREEPDPTKRPRLIITYAENSATVNASPMTGSGSSVDPTVFKETRPVISAMTGSGEFPLPTFTAEVTPDVNVAPEPMTGSGTMPGGNFTMARSVSVSPLEANAEITTATVTSFVNAIPVIAPMRASADLYPPLEAGNIVQDRYFTRVKATTDSDDYIGFGSATGFRRFVGGTGAEESLWSIVGDWNNGIFGPESRRAINLPGSYVNNDSNKPPMFTWTFETVLRTEDADGTLVAGLDFSDSSNTQYSLNIVLSGGKVGVTRGTQSVIGRNRIDDGNWHHIIVTFGGGSGIDSGLRVFIDGKLDIRRELFGIASNTTQWAGPDRFFGDLNAQVESFVFRRSADMDEKEIVQNYYAAMGIYPIAAGPMTASAAMPNARGKGNQKRALMLYFVWGYANNAFGQPVIPIVNERSYDRFPGDFEFGPNIPINGPSDFAGYKVFPVDANGGYRDEITDFPRLIDLEKDLNIDDYDLIMFRNWPNENTEIDALAANSVTREKLENLLKSVRWAVDQGKGLLITDPGLANDMGIIQSAAAVPVMYESDFVNYQGNASGDYDRRSYDIDPWATPDSAQFPADYYAHFYRDTHTNNRERVAATIAGLTDIPSYTLADWFVRDQRDPFKLGGLRSLKYEYKNALAIGDEFVNLSVPTFNPGDPDDRGQRRANIWAVPPGGIKAGKAVTTLGNTIFNGGTEVPNPYANWAVTIAIEPGDSLNGTPVGGKIFVNIGEELYNAGGPQPAKIQIVPDNSDIPNPADWETPAQRAWQYSANRWNIGYSSVGGGSGGSSNEQGSVDAGAGKTGNWSPDLAGVDVSEKYPTQDISIHTMMSRALVWLGITDDREPGDAIVRVAAMTANAEMKQPGTTAQKPAQVNAPAMIANARMIDPAEAEDGNATVYVLPMEATATVTGYSKRIEVAPMEASAEFVDNFNLVFAGGEQVVLVLHNVEAILIIEEGT